jgi:hypothetical protein
MELGSSFVTPGVEVWFPLGKRIGLRCRADLVSGYGRLPAKGVRIINRNMMRVNSKRLYASEPSDRTAADFNNIEA